MNDLLAARSSVLGGVFTREDALDCGYTDMGLRTLVRSGECRRLARGVYAVPIDGQTAEERHRQLVRGLLRRFDGRAAASHHSALVLHGLPAHGVDLSRAHLTTLGQGHGRVRPEFSLHRRVRGVEFDRIQGCPTVPVALASAQTAAEFGSTPGVIAADAALHRKLIVQEDLSKAVGRVANWPGGREAQTMAKLADGRSESVGESRLRLAFHVLRIPVEPQYQIRVGDRVIARADFRVTGTRLLIEFDGMLKYRGQDGEEAIIREKKREDLVRRHTWDFERFVWDDLDRLSLIAERVREGCRRAA